MGAMGLSGCPTEPYAAEGMDEEGETETETSLGFSPYASCDHGKNSFRRLWREAIGNCREERRDSHVRRCVLDISLLED